MVVLRNSREYDPADVKRFIDEGYWNDDTLRSWLEHWAEKTPDKIAILAPDEAITYAEALEKARRLAGAMLDLGLRKGEAVAIQATNTPEFVIAFFGVAMMGGVMLTMHMPYRAGEMKPLLEHGQARVVICGPADDKYDAPATMESLKAEVPSLEHVIVSGGPAGPGQRSLTEMIETGRPREITDPPTADDAVFLCFTSGTVGAPKAILHSYRTACGNGRNFAGSGGIAADDVVMVGPPFTHAFGLCCTLYTLGAGATNALMEKFTPPDYAATIERFRPTVLFTAPAHIAATLKDGLFERHDISSLERVYVGGSICPPDVAAGLEALMSGGQVNLLFGVTETLFTLLSQPDQPAEIRHRLAVPGPGYEARVVGEQGTTLEPGREGELQIRGYPLMVGYLNNEAATIAAFTADNWLRTGDLAVMDPGGGIANTGRVKDIINRGGIKFNPTDQENLIIAHPKVTMAAIVPMADDVLGERACLYVTLMPDASLTLEEVTAYLGAHGIAKVTWPEHLVAVEDMPLGPTRKILKGALVQMVG
jgi:non-ribosomal peptide synthetase component E (peptide arylation enzyme)